MASVTLVAIALVGYAGATARGASPQPGAALVQKALSGQTKCPALSSAQFVLVGESVMTRMIDSAAARNAMTAHIRTLWAAGGLNQAGLNQAYQFVGKRFAGCASGDGPKAFGAMMGIMGGGMMGASVGDGSTGYSTAAYRPAYVMGGSYNGASTMMGNGNASSHHSGVGSATIVAIGMASLALLAAAIALTLVISRRRRSSAQPGPA